MKRLSHQKLNDVLTSSTIEAEVFLTNTQLHSISTNLYREFAEIEIAELGEKINPSAPKTFQEWYGQFSPNISGDVERCPNCNDRDISPKQTVCTPCYEEQWMHHYA